MLIARLGCIGAILALGFATHVSAQEATDARQQARVLYRQGVTLADQGEWEVAARRFSQAYELHPSATTSYNLGAALAQMGRLVDACGALDRAETDPGARRAVRRAARRLFEQLEPRLGRLAVHLAGPIDDVTTTLDGEDLTVGSLGHVVPIDPGPHRVAIIRDGVEVSDWEGTVDEGALVAVNLQVPVPPPPREAALALNPAPRADRFAADPPPSPEVWEQWWFWTAAAAVLVGGAVTVAIVADGAEAEAVPGNFSPGIVEIGL